jgi:hypothetical protein
LAGRQKEFAIRQSLGASPLRIAREVLAESLGMAGVTAVGGILVAFALTALLRDSMLADYAPQLPPFPDAGPGLCACCFCLALLAGLIAGAPPAIAIARQQANNILRGRNGSVDARPRRWMRGSLIGAEVALAGAVLTMAALAIDSVVTVDGAGPGFSTLHVLTAEVDFTRAPGVNGAAVDAGETVARERALLERLRGSPGLAAAGLSSALPLTAAAEQKLYLWRGTYSTGVVYFAASGSYFQALQIPLVAGRTFADDDRQVLIVSRRLAEDLWSGGNSIGAEVTLDGEAAPRRVIGVVGDLRARTLWDQQEPQMYLPFTYPYRSRPVAAVQLALRYDRRPAGLASLRRQVQSAADGAPVYDWLPYEDLVRTSLGPARARALLLGAFAICAWLIACTACLLWPPTRLCPAPRRWECAPRWALSPLDIAAALLSESFLATLAGVACGAFLALALSGLMSGLIAGISPFDPASYAASARMLLGGALAGGLLPSLKAARRTAISQAIRLDGY